MFINYNSIDVTMEIFEIEKIPSISAIFNESQLDNTHNPLVSKLIRIFNEVGTNENNYTENNYITITYVIWKMLQTPVDKFTSAFVTCLKTVLSIGGDVNVSVERIFEFATQFIIIVARLDGETAEDNSHIPDESFHFVYSVFNFFEQVSSIPLRL